MNRLEVEGLVILKGALDRATQEQIRDDIRDIAKTAPFYSPLTPWGKPMSVKMTSAGQYGWYTDRKGYRYITEHPNGTPWPDIPASILSIWSEHVSTDRAPECCLCNFYSEKARMGLHQDKDEADFTWPVLSISLGDSGLFRIGGEERSNPTQSIWLDSGDIVIMGGEARLKFHGIDRIKFGSSDLLNQNGRLNITLRVVG